MSDSNIIIDNTVPICKVMSMNQITYIRLAMPKLSLAEELCKGRLFCATKA